MADHTVSALSLNLSESHRLCIRVRGELKDMRNYPKTSVFYKNIIVPLPQRYKHLQQIMALKRKYSCNIF
ncbi:hypothetical protein RRG08_030776 [Elysia crispata]|uniref:Uncharacterized protein n=1 Tax=Elysia crispata TaxID=231223 RepID=A0AAE0YF34_9GAST|nr:hypothetical protein RRG08_030776 [Elysia crispata]